MLLFMMIVFICLAVAELALAWGRWLLTKGTDPAHRKIAKDIGLVFGLLADKLSGCVPRGPACRSIMWGEFLVLRSIVSPGSAGNCLRVRIAVAYGVIFHFLASALTHVSPRLERLALLEMVASLEMLVSMAGISL